MLPENIDANMLAWARDDLAECASQGVFRNLTPEEAIKEVSDESVIRWASGSRPEYNRDFEIYLEHTGYTPEMGEHLRKCHLKK